MWKKLSVLILLIALANAACKLTGCTTCTTKLVSNIWTEECTACRTGYVVNSSIKQCDFDIGLVVGVSIAAVLIVAIQITSFLFCKAYFEHAHKRKIQFTLEDIFEQLEEERNDPAIKQQLENKYDVFLNTTNMCQYCYNLPEQEQPQFKEMKNRIAEKAKKDAEKNSQAMSNDMIEGSSEEDKIQIPPHPFGPTVKLKCSTPHLYHLQCLKKHLLQSEQKSCKVCSSIDITPFNMICVECKLKDRLLKLELTKQNINQIQDYICSICYRRKKDKEERAKWWKRLF